MTTTTPDELTFEDLPFPEQETIVHETIPEDTYLAKLVGFRTVAKPDFKIDQQYTQLLKKDSQATREEVDDQQWEFTFQLAGGDYDGSRLSMYANRTFHERSTAGKAAAALMGMDVYVASVMRDLGGTGILAGKPCRIDVVEKQGKDGTYRNYVNDVKRIPEKRHRETTQKPATGRVQLPDYPHDPPAEGDENEIEF